MAIDQDILMRTVLAERAKVLAYIRSIVRRRDWAEDVFQDVCVIALEQRERIIDEQHLCGWMRTTARLRAMNMLRKRQNRQASLDDYVLDQLEPLWVQEDATPDSIRSEALADCMSQLTERARQLLQTRYSEGLSVEEIAKRADRPTGSVYVTLSRIHSALADCVFRRLPAGGTRG